MAAASGPLTRSYICRPARSASRLRLSTCVAVAAGLQGSEKGNVSWRFATYLRRRGLHWRSRMLHGRCCSDRVGAGRNCQQQLNHTTVVARLFDPEDFNASKLTVQYDAEADVMNAPSIEDLLPRKYTLTHSDVTGELLLSIGPSYNRFQLAGWYTRLMRDEIVAEWRSNGQMSLHVHCHVSGGHILLAPAALRNSIFEREMPLVLEAIRYGDNELLTQFPGAFHVRKKLFEVSVLSQRCSWTSELEASTVWVHFHSSNTEFNRADCWGPLFYAASSMSRVPGASIPSKLAISVTPQMLVDPERESVELCTSISP